MSRARICPASVTTNYLEQSEREVNSKWTRSEREVNSKWTQSEPEVNPKWTRSEREVNSFFLNGREVQNRKNILRM